MNLAIFLLDHISGAAAAWRDALVDDRDRREERGQHRRIPVVRVFSLTRPADDTDGQWTAKLLFLEPFRISRLRVESTGARPVLPPRFLGCGLGNRVINVDDVAIEVDDLSALLAGHDVENGDELRLSVRTDSAALRLIIHGTESAWRRR